MQVVAQTPTELVVFWLSADRRYVVDRSRHTVSIIVQRLVHRTTTLLAFNDIVYTPVTANVTLSGVGEVRGNKGTSYKPVVVYNYRYQGNPYEASTVMPITISAGQAWAKSIADTYRPGQVTTAYVNPDHPNSAYLVRRVSLMPLIFVAFPLFFGLLYGWILRTQRAQVQLAQEHLVPVVSSV